MDATTASIPAQPANARVDEPPVFSLQDVLTILLRDRRRILLGFGIPFALTLLFCLLSHASYTSEASLLVKLGREYVYMADSSGVSGNGGATPVMYDSERALNAETQIITSRDLVRQVIEEIGVDRLYPALAGNKRTDQTGTDRAVEVFRKDLEAEVPKDSTVIDVRFKHADPALAETALQRLLEAYMQRRREIFAGSGVSFLTKQVDIFREQLQAADARLEAFKQQYGIINYDQQVALALQQANELQKRLDESNQQVAIASTRERTLKQIVSKVPANLTQYSESTADPTLPQKLLDLQLKAQDLAGRYVEGNPLVVSARRDAATASTFVERQKTDPVEIRRVGRNPVRDATEQDLVKASSEEPALRSGHAALKSQLDQLNRQAEALSQQETAYQALNRERKLLEDSYVSYAKKLEDARINEARDQQEKTNVSVFQAASYPLEKKSMRGLILAAGFFLSVGVALVVAFLSEALRPGFLSAGQLERRSGLPVLATFPLKQA